ncbi:hypothetical protein EON73_03275, partial [bacterium]
MSTRNPLAVPCVECIYDPFIRIDVAFIPIPPAFVQAQIESVLTDINVGAIKTGMLATAGIIAAVAEALCAHTDIPLVLDPVMVSTSGDRLLAEDAVDVLIKKLIPRATILTPNLHEAAA